MTLKLHKPAGRRAVPDPCVRGKGLMSEQIDGSR